MALVADWFRQLRQEWRIPEIDAERCVHSHCEVAQCTRCVDACPRDAWILTDDSLQIDTGRCDGCGLCTAVCSESALGQDLLPALRMLRGGATLLLACEMTRERVSGDGVVPCLHAISTSWLLAHYRNGYQQILSCRRKCETCPRFGGRDFFRERLGELNQLLASRAAPLLRHRQLAPQRWRQLRDHAPDDKIVSRRQFLRQAVSLTVEKGIEQAGMSETETAADLPWLARLPANNSPDRLYPFVPAIDPARCNGCDACVQLCPHQALALETPEDETALAYRIKAERCTGCAICTDACDRQAIKISRMQVPQETHIALNQATCKACGARFHYPTGSDEQQYCRICSHTNHHRKLFQVY